MFFYKTLKIQNIGSEEIENGIRFFTKRRKEALDVISTISYIGEDKYFLGVENDTAIEVTRIKSPMEFFMPRVIVQFPKKDPSWYKVRMGFLHLGLLVFLAYPALMTLLESVASMEMNEDCPLFHCLLFI